MYVKLPYITLIYLTTGAVFFKKENSSHWRLLYHLKIYKVIGRLEVATFKTRVIDLSHSEMYEFMKDNSL